MSPFDVVDGAGSRHRSAIGWFVGDESHNNGTYRTTQDVRPADHIAPPTGRSRTTLTLKGRRWGRGWARVERPRLIAISARSPFERPTVDLVPLTGAQTYA